MGVISPRGQNENYTKIVNFWTPFLKNKSSDFSKNFRVKTPYKYLPMFKFYHQEDILQTVHNIKTSLRAVCRGHQSTTMNAWKCISCQGDSEDFRLEWKHLVPPSSETGNSYITWPGVLMGFNGSYIFFTFGNILLTHSKVIGLQSLSNTATPNPPYWQWKPTMI